MANPSNTILAVGLICYIFLASFSASLIINGMYGESIEYAEFGDYQPILEYGIDLREITTDYYYKLGIFRTSGNWVLNDTTGITSDGDGEHWLYIEGELTDTNYIHEYSIYNPNENNLSIIIWRTTFLGTTYNYVYLDIYSDKIVLKEDYDLPYWVEPKLTEYETVINLSDFDITSDYNTISKELNVYVNDVLIFTDDLEIEATSFVNNGGIYTDGDDTSLYYFKSNIKSYLPEFITDDDSILNQYGRLLTLFGTCLFWFLPFEYLPFVFQMLLIKIPELALIIILAMFLRGTN